MVKKRHGLLCAALAFGCGIAQAADENEFVWHGFLNTIYNISNSKTVYNEVADDKGEFHASSAGLALSVKLPENWSAAMQLHSIIAEDSLIMDWAFATYQPQDSFALRVGKIKYPGALVSEYLDVGFAQPWTAPPEEFYSDATLGSNMTMEAFTGVTPVFTKRGGNLRYVLQPYFGENKHDDGENRRLLGVKARMSGDGFEALVNYSSAKLDLLSTSSRFAETNDKGVQVWNVGASLDRDNMLVMAEYGKSRVDNASAFDTTAGYATLGYHFGRYLPSLTYGFFDQDSGLGQKSIALTVRRELTSFSAVKVQLKSIDPDQRRTALAGGEQPSGLFEASPAEERVRILSLSLNLVF